MHIHSDSWGLFGFDYSNCSNYHNYISDGKSRRASRKGKKVKAVAKRRALRKQGRRNRQRRR